MHFFLRRETLYAELVRSSERLESVSPSQVKEATAEDGLDGPLFRSNLACRGEAAANRGRVFTILAKNNNRKRPCTLHSDMIY